MIRVGADAADKGPHTFDAPILKGPSRQMGEQIQQKLASLPGDDASLPIHGFIRHV